MKCKKCGNEIPEKSIFCQFCGERVNNESEMINEEKTIDTFPNNDTAQKPVRKKKKRKIIFAIAIIVVILTLYTMTKCEHEWSDVDCLEVPICELCGKSAKKPLPHDWEEATCTTAKKCKKCGKTAGKALGHDWEEATCTEAKHCKRCDEQEGEKLGHISDNWTIIKNATCTTEGEKKGVCSRCNQEVIESIEKSEHKPGEWIIKEKATINSSGKKIKICSVCKNECTSESYSLSDAEIKSSAKSYGYKELARNPDSYEGKIVKFRGKVVQVSEAQSILYYSVYRINVTRGSYGYYDDTVYVTFDNSSKSSRILEDDIVDFYGEYKGLKTYETVMGAEITIPWVEAKVIDVVG